MAGAAALLALLWLVIRDGTRRLPLRPLFLGTSLFLLVMAARFTAAAAAELQEQGVLGFAPVDLVAPLAALGLPGSLEGLVVFGLVLALAPVALWPRRRPAAPAAPASAALVAAE